MAARSQRRLGPRCGEATRATAAEYGMLLAIVAGAFALRIYGLTFQSLWNDELSTLSRSSHETVGEVIRIGVGSDVHPPAHFLLIHAIVRWFGDSAWALRFPSVVFGTLSVPAIYGLGRRLYGAREGLTAAALTAVLWLPIYYSQDARPYAMMMLPAIVSSHAMVIICERSVTAGAPGRQWPAVAFVSSALLCAYTHYYGLLFVVIQGVLTASYFVGMRRYRESRLALGLFLLCALAYLPWVPFVLKQMDYTRGIAEPTPRVVLDYALFLFNESKTVASAAAAVAIAWAASWLSARASNGRAGGSRWSWPTVALLCWLILPLAITYAQSIAVHPVLRLRNLVISAPAAYLLLARGITVLQRRRGSEGLPILATLAVLGCLGQLVFSSEYYTKPTKAQFRETAQYVVDHFDSVPDAVVIGSAHRVDYFNYMFRTLGSDLRIPKQRMAKAQHLGNLDAFLDERKPTHIWYMFGHLRPHPSLLARVRRDYRQVGYHRFKQAGVYLFERRRNAARTPG